MEKNGIIVNQELLLVVITYSVALFSYIFVLRQPVPEYQIINQKFLKWTLFAVPLALIALQIILNLWKIVFQIPKHNLLGSEPYILSEKHSQCRENVKNSFLQEWGRKLFHFNFLLLLVVILMIIANFLMENSVFWDPERYWGSFNPQYILHTIQHPEFQFTGSHIYLVAFLYGTVCITVNFEITRHSNTLAFPFSLHIQKVLRESEKHTFATHTHNAVGFFLLVFYLPVNFFLVAVWLFTMGDTFAAIIGKHFGKHHLLKTKKTWEGLVAGIVVSAIGGWIFLGMEGLAVAAMIYCIVDMISPTLIKISDNLLIPLVSLIAFVIFQPIFVESFPLLEWFPFF